MSTVTTILDECEQRLHDPSNKIWSRAELLGYLNEAQRELSVQSNLLASLAAYDSPGRWGYAASQPWEVEQVRPARAWLPFLRGPDAKSRSTGQWEIEFIDGRTPTTSVAGITQPWEIAHQATDRPLPFPAPHGHLRTIKASWDLRRIGGTTTKDLDDLEYDWWTDTGLPQWVWADTLGSRQFGIFPLHAGYNQSFALGGTIPNGSPREYSGDRTYGFSSIDPCLRLFNGHTCSGDELHAISPSWRFTRKASDSSTSFPTHIWEEEIVEGSLTFSASETIGSFGWEDEHGAQNVPDCFILGIPRTFSGRDYMADDPAYGTPRSWQSTDGQLGLWHSTIPADVVEETDSPNEIHPRLHKYLRSYICWKAFDRQGPGRNPKLAAFYRIHFNVGLKVFRMVAQAFMREIEFRRETFATVDRRPPRVTLPPEFPRVLV